MSKKPIFKRWTTYLYAFIALVIIGNVLPNPSESESAKVEVNAEKPEGKKEVTASVEQKPTEEEKAAAEKAAQEQAKKEAAEKEKKDAEAAAASKEAEELSKILLQTIIDESGGVIVDIAPSPSATGWDVTYVTVSDVWYDSPEHEKERFADTVGAAVKSALNGEATLVNFYDTYGKELASEKMFGGYKIKR